MRNELPVRVHTMENVIVHPVQNADAPNTNWKSCCFEIDARVFQFIAVLIVTILVLLFCMFQLIRNAKTCPEQQMYVSILTLVLGVFLPNPRIR
jgi:hypothetical protein